MKMTNLYLILLCFTWTCLCKGNNLPYDFENSDKSSVALLDNVSGPLYVNLNTSAINVQLKSYIDKIVERDINETFENKAEDIVNVQFENVKARILEQCSVLHDITEKKEDLLQMTRGVKDQFQNLQDDLIKTAKSLKETFLDDIEELKQTMSRMITDKDCTDLKKIQNVSTSHIYDICPDKKVKVYCDMTTDGGGWTIIQRRSGISAYNVNFQRNWTEYENGFGDPYGDYWLGNKLLHIMTSNYRYELRIELTDMYDTMRYAVYKVFIIGDSSSKYKLTIRDYFGYAGDQMVYSHGAKFSTYDQDNDMRENYQCASKNEYGPWWHKVSCARSALNRRNDPLWFGFSNVVKSVMMIRRLD